MKYCKALTAPYFSSVGKEGIKIESEKKTGYNAA